LILRGLIRALVIIWVVMTALIGMAVGVGTLIPSGDEMTYANILDIERPNSINVFIWDMSRGLEEQLTNGDEINALAKWSPDGQQIAYLSLKNNVFQVYLMDAAGRDKRQLGVEFTAFYSTHVWSPDSQWILFFVTHKDVSKSLIVNAHTGEQYQLPLPITNGMWSPDSQNIIYEARSKNDTLQLYGMNIGCFAQSSCQFSELDFLDDSANEMKPVWSPDGKHLAYTQIEGSAKLMVATLRCTDLKASCIENRKTIAGIFYPVTPTWSADSKRLAYASSKSEIRIVEVESSETRTYAISSGIPAIQNWSPDGHFITYISSQSDNHTLFILDTLSGETYPLLQHQVISISPSWRPLPR
jgi:Tol biopolymer transport system component